MLEPRSNDDYAAEFDSNSVDVQKLYKASFDLYGLSPLSLLWPSTKLQVQRFKELRIIDIPKKDSVLDVGCGLADLNRFLTLDGWEGQYCGIDIVEEFLTAIKKDQPFVNVKLHDISVKPTIDKYDWCFISGLFNTKFRNAFGHMQKILRHCYNSTVKGVFFNFIQTSVGENRPQMSYYSVNDVVYFCESEFPASSCVFRKSSDGNVSVLILKH